MICPKCNEEKKKEEMSVFNKGICKKCLHHTDAKGKYFEYLKNKPKNNQFPKK